MIDLLTFMHSALWALKHMYAKCKQSKPQTASVLCLSCAEALRELTHASPNHISIFKVMLTKYYFLLDNSFYPIIHLQTL